jgi:hypothetical protein
MKNPTTTKTTANATTAATATKTHGVAARPPERSGRPRVRGLPFETRLARPEGGGRGKRADQHRRETRAEVCGERGAASRSGQRPTPGDPRANDPHRRTHAHNPLGEKTHRVTKSSFCGIGREAGSGATVPNSLQNADFVDLPPRTCGGHGAKGNDPHRATHSVVPAVPVRLRAVSLTHLGRAAGGISYIAGLRNTPKTKKHAQTPKPAEHAHPKKQARAPKKTTTSTTGRKRPFPT